MTTISEDVTAGLVMPDGTTVPLESDEASNEIRRVVANAHGVDPDTGELFDPKPYTIPLPVLDGHRADTLKLAFTGGIEIDPMIDDDLDWFKTLSFGQEIELGYNLGFRKTAEPQADERGNIIHDGHGHPKTVDVWTLQLIDQAGGRELLISFTNEVKDELVKQLTGGIVVIPANGNPTAHLPFGKGV